jgi:regulator of replication initiation timing
LLDLLQQKIEKDYAKMKNLMNEKNKMREIIDNLKLQLNEKDQEISGLKDKIENLRKNNQQLKSQNSILNKKNLDDNSS